MEEKKSSNDWWHDHKLFPSERIKSPDGWDRENLHFSFYVEEITYEMFENRLAMSTMVPREKATK